MTILGVHIGAMSGIWILSGAIVCYFTVLFLFWCILAMAGDADTRRGWK